MRKNYESDPNIETSDLTLKLAVLFPKDGRVPFQFVAVPLDWNFYSVTGRGAVGNQELFFYAKHCHLLEHLSSHNTCLKMVTFPSSDYSASARLLLDPLAWTANV